MNLKEFIKQPKSLIKKSIKHAGETISFYVKQESAFDQVSMLENSGELMTAVMKMQSSKEKGEDFKPTGEEAAAMRKHRARQVLCLVCNADGSPLFANLDDLLRSMTSDLIDKISEALEETETVDEAEKN